MDVKWIKVVTRFYDTPKLRMLRGEQKGERLLLIWLMLISLAGFCNQDGRLVLRNGLAYNMKTLAKEMDFSEKTLEFAFEQFVKFNMIILEDGVYAIKNWEKYQNGEALDKIRQQNKIRKQRQRERDKSVTVTECHAIEEEREKDKESEKEYHSIIHVCTDKSDDFVENFVENPKRKYIMRRMQDGIVKLSDEELDDLMDRMTMFTLEKYIGIVRENEQAGKHYTRKSHYQAIMEMAEADGKLA